MSVIDCVLYDMDGVLASVGDSYRESIIKTAARFGAIITSEDVSIEKKNGNANNDWILSKKLIESKKPGCMVTIEEVTAVFEEIYQGTYLRTGSYSFTENKHNHLDVDERLSIC
jgi:phosphoglycolate phosphatase-like HAD superfamily hydrolase